MPSANPTLVTTFYSFKGGVGRTLLMANVGALLAKDGKRVLLWDMDVEAPGLHRIPALKPGEATRGFFEWFGPVAEAGEVSEEAAEDLLKIVRPVPEQDLLWILPAFGEGADFGRLYHDIDWQQLLVKDAPRGIALFRRITDLLCRDPLRPDEPLHHLLIDSRTGVTDVGGLLAVALPNATVLVGSYGHQNLHGLLHVRRALERMQTHDEGARPGATRALPSPSVRPDGTAPQFFHVVSPVPEDTPAAAERRTVWREVMGDSDPLEVPFDKRLLWQEELLGITDPRSAVAGAYASVTRRLEAIRDERLDDLREGDEPGDEVEVDRLHEGLGYLERDVEFVRRASAGLSSSGRTFESRVARVMELLGWKVVNVDKRPDRAPRLFDLHVTAQGVFGSEEMWVEIKDLPRAGVGVVRRVMAERADPNLAAGSFVLVARGFTRAALAEACPAYTPRMG